MAGKIFDVAKPGTTKPSSTSKPVIIGHKAKLDPMVSSSSVEPMQSAEPAAATAPLLPKSSPSKPTAKASTSITVKMAKADKADKLTVPKVRSTIKILPAEDDKTEDEENPTKDFKPELSPEEENDNELISEIAKPKSEPKSKLAVKSESEPEQKPEPIPESAPEAEATPERPTKDTTANSIDDAIKDPAEADDKKPANPEAKAAEAQRDMIEKLVKDETYAIPIKTVTERRVRRGAIIALFVGLVVVTLYVLVDAGILKPGFDVPFHLIKH
jgi:hypothetical protein